MNIILDSLNEMNNYINSVFKQIIHCKIFFWIEKEYLLKWKDIKMGI